MKSRVQGEMTDNVKYAKPLTVTEERLRDAVEKQAKQRALRDALDSQVEQRKLSNGGRDTSGLTKAQIKRQELFQMQFDQQQRQPPPPPSSNVAPPPIEPTFNYSYVSSHDAFQPPQQQQQQQHPSTGGRPAYMPNASLNGPIDIVNRAPQPPKESYVEQEQYHRHAPYLTQDLNPGINVLNDMMQFINKVTDVRGPPTTSSHNVRQSTRGMDKGSRSGVVDDAKSKASKVRVEQLQRELQDRQHEMQKMRDKERDWEQQVRQLKGELKNAKQKEHVLNKLVNDKPQRAETAPNTGSVTLVPAQETAKRKPPRQSNQGSSKLLPLGTDTKLQPPPSQQQLPVVPSRKDFNNARVWAPETFRPITAPLEPLGNDPKASVSQLPPLPESLKLASFNSRKIAFGLPQQSEAISVPLDYLGLLQFVDSQVITQKQAEQLWILFGNSSSPIKSQQSRPSPPAVGGGAKKMIIPSSPTYETYADLNCEYDDDLDDMNT